MSSWYVWSALGLYPEIPGRAELLLGSPLFAHAVIHGSGGDVVIDAPAHPPPAFYVNALSVDGKPYDRPWLSPQVIEHGGQLHFTWCHAEQIMGQRGRQRTAIISPPRTDATHSLPRN
jgi:putative alpha-1,2-mannosidase